MKLFDKKKKIWWDRLSDKEKSSIIEHQKVFGGKVVRIEFLEKQYLWRVNV